MWYERNNFSTIFYYSVVKRFEENKDVVTLYFDKLTGQTNCVSLIVIRENIVDRTEPANVKLYDYYQKEFEVSTVRD